MPDRYQQGNIADAATALQVGVAYRRGEHTAERMVEALLRLKTVEEEYQAVWKPPTEGPAMAPPWAARFGLVARMIVRDYHRSNPTPPTV